MRVIYFFRNDLRLSDNQTLYKALELASEICFCYSPTRSHRRAGAYRQAFITSSLHSLSTELATHRHSLVIEKNSPLTIAHQNIDQFDAFALASEPTFEEQQDLDELKSFCQLHQKTFITFDTGSLLDWSSLPFETSKLPKVFTEFRKKVEVDLKVPHLSLEPNLKVKASALGLQKVSSPTIHNMSSISFVGGEKAAQARLFDYLWGTHAIETYKETRNGLIDFDDSSKLSPWLSLGCISPRQVYWELKRYEEECIKNESTYWLFFELLWREYFRLYAFLHKDKIFSLEGPFKISKKYLPYNDDNLKKFEQWQQGKTDNSFVNAGMIELAKTGFLSNRLRQNVAGYLCKTLELPWTWGAAYFEEVLLDYDAASNWGNWNYVAGVGTDPRDRIFNPDRQAEMYDPEGVYQKKWLTK